ncbi:polysaccharide deacetylase family protein [Roseateles amylovorans]|uniref:Polysaccharide deacetylase family protein n=1 Tax=Roseateles amylovorans TaxID=2978473 RepID=A0ABY6AXT4_9BURK|nr:polysaccharide deacetylase family protein [Roseateles amylovorans]UXH78001.1 polysaccharide deacetylase family protein [Roseateles amylovorans]
MTVPRPESLRRPAATPMPLMARLRTALLALLMLPVCSWSAPDKRIVITIDDLPFASATPMTVPEAARLNEALLRTLQRHQAPAIGFVNEDRLLVPGQIDRGVAILDAWLDAGMALGNHNFGHLGLWTSSVAEVQAAVLRGEVFTRWLTTRRGAPLRYYRPPFTQTGRTEADRLAFETFLQAHGYTLAPFTVEHDDYLFACVYDHLDGTDAAATRQIVEDEYDAHLRRAVAVFESMSAQLFERQIPQIWLIHANRLNADTLDRSLTTLRSLGYRFISLDEALQDEAYRTPALASGKFGPSWLARWARSKGVKLSVYGQPDPDGQTAALHREHCGR